MKCLFVIIFFVSYADKKWAEDPRRPFPCGGRRKDKPDEIYQIQNEGTLAMWHEQSTCSLEEYSSRQVIFSCLIPLLSCGAVEWSRWRLLSNRLSLYRSVVWPVSKVRQVQELVLAVTELTRVRSKTGGCLLCTKASLKDQDLIRLASLSNMQF